MDWNSVSEQLKAKLDPRFVKPPPKGKYGDYIEAHHAISEANRIFGHGGWSYQLCDLRQTNATVDEESKHHIGYFAMVEVSVGGVSRSDVGHGQGHGKSEGDAHDSAVKEAVTDALKRALRTFGNPFGLALYDKTKSDVGVPLAYDDWAMTVVNELRPDATDAEKAKAVADALIAQVERKKTEGELTSEWKRRKPNLDKIQSISEALYGDVLDAFGRRKAELTTPAEAAE